MGLIELYSAFVGLYALVRIVRESHKSPAGIRLFKAGLGLLTIYPGLRLASKIGAAGKELFGLVSSTAAWQFVTARDIAGSGGLLLLALLVFLITKGSLIKKVLWAALTSVLLLIGLKVGLRLDPASEIGRYPTDVVTKILKHGAAVLALFLAIPAAMLFVAPWSKTAQK